MEKEGQQFDDMKHVVFVDQLAIMDYSSFHIYYSSRLDLVLVSCNI